MADLTGIINQASPDMVINAWHEANQSPRARLGLSEIGHPCHRYLWYVHTGHKKQPVDGQTLRLFRLGNILEEEIIKNLTSAGFAVHSRQKELSFEGGGTQLTGHIDGIIDGLYESSKPHLLEIKTSSDKYFNDLKKKRSYEIWNQKYKAQVHIYMLGSNLKRCLAIVYNKNTSELYTERIKLNHDYAIRLLHDVFQAIQKPEPPERKCPNASWFEAKWCPFYGECFT